MRGLRFNDRLQKERQLKAVLRARDSLAEKAAAAGYSAERTAEVRARIEAELASITRDIERARSSRRSIGESCQLTSACSGRGRLFCGCAANALAADAQFVSRTRPQVRPPAECSSSRVSCPTPQSLKIQL